MRALTTYWEHETNSEIDTVEHDSRFPAGLNYSRGELIHLVDRQGKGHSLIIELITHRIDIQEDIHITLVSCKRG